MNQLRTDMNQVRTDALHAALWMHLRKLTVPSFDQRTRIAALSGPLSSDMIQSIIGNSTEILECYRDCNDSRYDRIRSIIHPCVSRQYELVDQDINEVGHLARLYWSFLLCLLRYRRQDNDSAFITKMSQFGNGDMRLHPPISMYDCFNSNMKAVKLLFENLRHSESHNAVWLDSGYVKFHNKGGKHKSRQHVDYEYTLSIELMYKICRYLVFFVYNVYRNDIDYEEADVSDIREHLFKSMDNSDGFMIILHTHGFMSCLSSDTDIYTCDVYHLVSEFRSKLLLSNVDFNMFDMDAVRTLKELCAFIPYWLFNASKNADGLSCVDADVLGLDDETMDRGFVIIYLGLILTTVGYDLKDVVYCAAESLGNHYKPGYKPGPLRAMLCSTLKTLQVLCATCPRDEFEITQELGAILVELRYELVLKDSWVTDAVRFILETIHRSKSVQWIRDSPWNDFINRLDRRFGFNGRLRKVYPDLNVYDLLYNCRLMAHACSELQAQMATMTDLLSTTRARMERPQRRNQLGD